MRRPSRATILAFAVALAGCGVLQPTPARFHPPLPEGEVLPPHVRAEELVAFWENEAFDCRFSVTEDLIDAEGNPHSGWTCRSGDQLAGNWSDVGVSGAEDGPVESVSMYIFRDDGSDAAALSASAAARFEALVVAPVVPEEHRPSSAALFDAVQRNVPMNLGGGWLLDFERSSVTRSIRVIFAPNVEWPP